MPSIKEIDISPYVLSRSSLTTAQGKITDRQSYRIQITDREGNVGYGEAAPLAMIGTESCTACDRALGKMKESLQGASFTTIVEVTNLLQGLETTPAARHGMELALLDLLAQFHQLPLAQYLDPSLDIQKRSMLPVNALIGMVPPEEARAQTAQYCREGYRCIKVKVGDGIFSRDRQRVQAVREAGGERLRIRLDANGAWHGEAADRYLAELQPYAIEYIEQPVATLAEMAVLKQRSPIPIAIDESIHNLATLHQALDLHVADILVLKPMLWGGILPTIGAANSAFQKGWDVVITSVLEGLIGRMGALHAGLALSKVSRPCGLYPGNWQGFLALLPGNGLGIHEKYLES